MNRGYFMGKKVQQGQRKSAEMIHKLSMGVF